MRCLKLVGLAVLAACGERTSDPAHPSASDSGPDATADTGPVTDLTGTLWSGSGQDLGLYAYGGFWSDGCYGGHITGPFTVTDDAIDWPAQFNVGAGAPAGPSRARGA